MPTNLSSTMQKLRSTAHLIQILLSLILLQFKQASLSAVDLNHLANTNPEHLGDRDPTGFFRLVEESPNGTEILGVSKYLQQRTFLMSPLMSSTRFLDLKFNFQLLDNHQPWTNYFHLEPQTGRLTIRHRIDREQLCAKVIQTDTQNHMSLNTIYSNKKPEFKCVKKLFVLSTAMGPEQKNEPEIRKIPIEILIVDINDNSPNWIITQNGQYLTSSISNQPNQIPVIELQLLEIPSDQLNMNHQQSTAILPQAVDLDEGINGQISYRLEPLQSVSANLPQESLTIDQSIPFLLRHTSQGQLELQSTTNLDYEKQKLYEFYLIATDSGFPSRTGTALIKVYVMDVNDESPRFEYTIYYPPNGAISEKTVPGTVILNLSATDADASAPNNRLRYSMIPGSLATNYFTVQNDGRITLKQWLDYETMDLSSTRVSLASHANMNQNSVNLNTRLSELEENRKQFVFQVKSVDSAPAPYERTGTATVIIPVIDENDEAPVITIRYLGFPELNRNGENGFIKENTPVPIKVAYIQIRDPDFDGQDQFLCHLSDTQNFSLNPVGSIDSSSSSPSSSTSSMSSSSPMNFDFAKSDQSDMSKNDFILTLIKKPDRERTPFLFVRIKCVDQAANANEQTLRLRILDENDEVPSFTKPLFHFSLPENTELVRIHIKASHMTGDDKEELIQGYRIGRVLANDKDKGDNAVLKYQLHPEFLDIVPAKYPPPSDLYNPTSSKDTFTILDWTHKFPPTSSLFRLDPDSGMLFALRSFDAENINLFRMQVLAVDQPQEPSEPRHTGTAVIEVQITNVNDWSPLFHKSDAKNNSKSQANGLEFTTHYEFSIKENQPIYTVIGHIDALDPDNGVKLDRDLNSKDVAHSHILFKMASDVLPETRQAFTLHASQGILRTAISLDREKQAVYVFHVIASDAGLGSSVSRSATATVTVFVEDENDNEPIFVRPVTSPNSNYAQPSKTDLDKSKLVDLKNPPKSQTNLGEFSTSNSNPRTRSYEPKSNVPIIVVHRNSKAEGTEQDGISSESRPLLQLEAVDADAGDNGKITYEISAGNTDNLFVLDADTGTLSLSPKLSHSKTGPISTERRHLGSSPQSSSKADRSNISHIMFMLRFEACDRGHPKRCAIPIWVQMVLELSSVPELVNLNHLNPYPYPYAPFNPSDTSNANRLKHPMGHGLGDEVLQNQQLLNQPDLTIQNINDLNNPKSPYFNHPHSESMMPIRSDHNLNDPVWAKFKYGASFGREFKQNREIELGNKRGTQLGPSQATMQTLNSSNVVVNEMVIICLVIIFVILMGAIIALVYLVRRKAILFTLATNPKLKNRNDNSQLDNDGPNTTLNPNTMNTADMNQIHAGDERNNTKQQGQYGQKMLCQGQSSKLTENSSLYRIVSGDLNMITTTIPKGMRLKAPDTRLISLSDGLSLDRQGFQPLMRRNSEPRINHGLSMTRLHNLSESVYVPRGLFGSPTNKFGPEHDYQVLTSSNSGTQLGQQQQQQQQRQVGPPRNRCLTPFWESSSQINSPNMGCANQYHHAWSKTAAPDLQYPGSMIPGDPNLNRMVLNQELNLCKSPTFYEPAQPGEHVVHYRGDSLPVYPMDGTHVHPSSLDDRNMAGLPSEPIIPYQQVPFVTATLRRYNRPLNPLSLIQPNTHQDQINNPYLKSPNMMNPRFIYPTKTIPPGSDVAFESSGQFFNTIQPNSNNLKNRTHLNRRQPKLYDLNLKDLDDGLTDRSDVPLFPKSPTSLKSPILSEQTGLLSTESLSNQNHFLDHFDHLITPTTTTTAPKSTANRFKQNISVNPLVLSDPNSNYAQKLIPTETDQSEESVQLDQSKSSSSCNDETQTTNLLSPQRISHTSSNTSNTNTSSQILTMKKCAYSAFREASFV